MLAIRLRSLSVPTLVMVFGLCGLLTPSHAQVDDTRPSVELTQQPTWNSLWPGDFNSDGITDLAAAAGGQLVTTIGRGDGTFDAPQPVDTTATTPVGVADVNGDGVADILATGNGNHILIGRGNATFTTVTLPAAVSLANPTHAIDMNNDGRLDLVSHGFDTVVIYPATGELTFGAPIALRTDIMKETHVVADLNGDGLPDVAATTHFSLLNLFFNQGNLTFTKLSIPVAPDGGGVAARDMNGDGIVDLIVGTGVRNFGTLRWSSGAVSVYLGIGDGTFQPPLTTPTNPGPIRLVIGDFTGDGIPDVATGNRSTVVRCDFFNHLWDSVSVLPGLGDGRLGPAASWALGDSEETQDFAYKNSLSWLNTSDLNADGRTDLLVSPGAILLMGPPRENRPPVANAGPDRVAPVDPSNIFNGSAFDPDHDWLTFEWKDESGNVIGNVPRSCLPTYAGTRVFTLTVSDGRGGVSSDAMQWTFASSPPLPPGFTSGNVGTVATEGFASFSQGVYRIAGSGADIWGTADAFRFAYTTMSGDFEAVTRVASVENRDPWTKAGLMVRQSLTPGSRHAFLFATPTAVNGIAFQRREVDEGPSVHTSGPKMSPPAWLRLVRQGSTISAFVKSQQNDAWSPVGTQTLTLTEPVYVGMAVTSHRDGIAATAFFDSLNIAPLSLPPGLPLGWEHAEVGTPAVAGSASYDGTAFAVQGSGVDIWDTGDSFHYAYTRLPENGAIQVRVTDIVGPHEWSKAGLMVRSSLDPSSAYHYLLLSEGHGLAYQRRLRVGEPAQHTDLGTAAAPTWYRIERYLNTVRLFYSTEPDTPTVWQPIGESFFQNGDVLAGLAVTSHSDGQLATGSFDNVVVTFNSTPAWSGAAIGDVALPGASQFDGTTWTLQASGSDIWDTEDGFRYTYRPLDGNGSIVARVASLAGPHPWSKAGVMIRQSTSSNSAHAFMFVSPENGVAFQRRPFEGTLTTHTSGGSGVAPQWLRLTRAGDLVTAAVSADGQTWTDVGSDTLGAGSTSMLIGIALTSHDNDALATATFDNVTVIP